MDKNKISKIVVSVLFMGLILSALVSVTYAMFSSDIYAKTPDVYTTGNLSIEAKSKSDNISLTNTLPMTDEEGISTSPYVFTIKNTGNLDYKFNVQLLSVSNNTFSSNYIKLQVNDSAVSTLSDLSSGIILKDVILYAGESMDISLKIWLDENIQNTELGKSFESKIVINGQAVYTTSETIDESNVADLSHTGTE